MKGASYIFLKIIDRHIFYPVLEYINQSYFSHEQKDKNILSANYKELEE